MARYAEGTSVSMERSKVEVESTLRRYGATAFQYGWEGVRVVLSFRAHERLIRFEMRMPGPDDDDIRFSPAGRTRTVVQAEKALEQEARRRWRALGLVIKAKLEAVESGLVSFEDEFLAHILLPDGTTVADHTGPALEQTYATGEMPDLLPAARPQLESG
jgi:hypothetical protein